MRPDYGTFFSLSVGYLQYLLTEGLDIAAVASPRLKDCHSLTQPTILQPCKPLALGMWVWDALFKKRPPKRTSGRLADLDLEPAWARKSVFSAQHAQSHAQRHQAAL